jgi:branched-chain amino acid transport system permease protein
VVAVAGTLSLSVSTPLIGVLIALSVALASAALHGFAIGRVALAKLRTASGQHVLIATVGLSLALSEYLRLMQGVETRWLPPVFNTPWPLLRHESFVATTTPVVLGAGLLGLAAAFALVQYLRHSTYGRSWRAIADDPKMAELMGVDQQAIYDRAVILACASAAAAGIIVTVIFGGLGYAGGFSLGLKALVAAVLGGIGSVGGAALGGLCIALLEAIWSSTMPIEARDIVVFALLALVLVIRPGGFFGHGELRPREV